MGSRGFSIIELVVVMAVMGILLSLATLDFGSFQRKAGVDSQVKELYADVQDARMKSVFTKRRHKLEFTSNQVSFRRYSSEGDQVGTLLSTKKLPYAITTNWSAPNSIEFDTKGIMNDASNVKVVCVTTPENASLDALIVTPVTTNLGKVTDRGAPCAITNVTQK